MGSLNDNMYTALSDAGYTGSLSDMLAAFKADNNLSGNDSWRTFLSDRGYTGSINDQASAYFAEGTIGPQSILFVGDSWLDFADTAMANVYPDSWTIHNRGVTSTPLLGPYNSFGEINITSRLAAAVATPEYEYTAIVLEGGINDVIYSNDEVWDGTPETGYPDGGFTLTQWKQAFIDMIDDCLAEGFENIIVQSMPCLSEWVTVGNIYYQMAQANPSILTDITAIDDWLEAYCAAVGVKFVNINQAPFTNGDYIPLDGMTSAAHPTLAGHTVIQNMIKDAVYQPVITRTTAMDVVLSRPNRALLTIADLQRLTQVVTDLDSEWSKIQELWLLDLTDVSAAGNALIGLKTNSELLPRVASAGNTVAAVTHDATANAKGMILEPTEILRSTLAATGRSVSIGTLMQTRNTLTASAFAGCQQGFSSNMLEFSYDGNTNILSGRGMSSAAAVTANNGSSNDHFGKVVELQVVANGSNQTVSLYKGGTQIATGSQTYAGSVPTQPIAFNATNINNSGTPFFSTAGSTTTTIAACYITDGTTTPSLFASALE